MKDLIEKAYAEDIPSHDITTRCLGITEKFGVAKLIAKQDLTLSGHKLFTQCLHHLDSELNVHWHFEDGQQVFDKQNVASISGNLIRLIQAERVALNFLGFLSGIATETRKYVDACTGTNTKILDTRKTLPLYRGLCKQAVLDGGGTNHRMNLSDAFLIKENHIVLAGSQREAIQKAKTQADGKIVEIEAKDLAEVKSAIADGVDRIMLDNMDIPTMIEALKLRTEGVEFEASGNMTLERIPEVAALGVDFISVGAITHSAPNADFSLLFEWD